jgi:hypothetical protein
MSISIALALAATASVDVARADEGGVSFWLPGGFGSLAAVPLQPGFSFTDLYVHSSVSGGGNVAASRALNIGTASPTLTVNLNASVQGAADLDAFIPTYAFDQKFLGGQLALSIMGAYGRSQAKIDANVTGALGPIGFAAERSISDALTDFGDLYPQATMRWNSGVHNFMVYTMEDVPVGAYDPHRIANLGIGHWAADGGGGYTYFDQKAGHEFSVVTGWTYNFINPSTQYQNGIDWHVDWGASQFVTKQVQLGAVGYYFQQITGDSGAGARLGAFESHIAGIGPQFGYLFPVGDKVQGYLNLKGYWEFDAQNRASGWNAWVTLSFSPAAETPQTAQKPMVYK